jgi:hypothetical protein
VGLATLCGSHQPKRELTHQAILSFFHTAIESPFTDRRKMSYTVTSDNFEAKKKGESITDKELLDLGLNADALVAGEHIKKSAQTKPATVEETK